MTEFKNTQQTTGATKETFSQDIHHITLEMEQEVKSGRVAAVFGPKYTVNALTALANQMKEDVLELTPGSGYVNKERKAAIEEEERNKLKTPLPVFLDKSFKEDLTEFYETIQREPQLRPFDSFVRGAFYSYFVGSNPAFSLVYDKAKIEMDAERQVGHGENMFLWEMDGKEKKQFIESKVKARVQISTKILPVTQEEYFHAAQELSMGNVDGLKYLDKRVSFASINAATHGSILIDRVLSSAAAEIGAQEFSYWAGLADRVTEEFAKQHKTNTKSKWDKTPLGKEVNKRFRYPIVNYAELGAMIYNYTRDIESFLFNPDGSLNEDNDAIFELLSLQFGPNHKEMSLALVDSVNTKGNPPDFEDLGRQLVERGKKILEYYKGKPEEYELVTHHTQMREPLDPTKLEYEVSKHLVYMVNSQLGKESGIPTTAITLQTVANDARDNATRKLETVIKGIQINLGNSTVQIANQSMLKEVGLDHGTFLLIVRHAFHSYQRHFASYQSETRSRDRFFSKKIFYEKINLDNANHIKDMIKLVNINLKN